MFVHLIELVFYTGSLSHFVCTLEIVQLKKNIYITYYYTSGKVKSL